LVGIESFEQVRNLLFEYRKWRPVVFLHYRFSNNEEKPPRESQVAPVTTMETLEKEPLSLRGKSLATSNYDSISRVSSNTMGLDYPTIVSHMDEGQAIEDGGKKAAVLKDDDLLEEFRYR